jgi:hypothetical protein
MMICALFKSNSSDACGFHRYCLEMILTTRFVIDLGALLNKGIDHGAYFCNLLYLKNM